MTGMLIIDSLIERQNTPIGVMCVLTLHKAIIYPMYYFLFYIQYKDGCIEKNHKHVTMTAHHPETRHNNQQTNHPAWLEPNNKDQV